MKSEKSKAFEKPLIGWSGKRSWQHRLSLPNTFRNMPIVLRLSFLTESNLSFTHKGQCVLPSANRFHDPLNHNEDYKI